MDVQAGPQRGRSRSEGVTSTRLLVRGPPLAQQREQREAWEGEAALKRGGRLGGVAPEVTLGDDVSVDARFVGVSGDGVSNEERVTFEQAARA